MTRKILGATILLLAFLSIGTAQAEVEWKLDKSLKLDAVPKDVATSPDGKFTYVLGENSTIFIYSQDGTLTDKIKVDRSVDAIGTSQDGSKLFLTSVSGQSLDIIDIDFIQKIDITGSPFKGQATAPVAIAVFSDFQ